MTVRMLPVAVLLLAMAVPAPCAFAARCRAIVRSPLHCTDGDPSCDLDGRCDGRCRIALCDTSSSNVPRPTFCAGSVTWTSLFHAPVGRSFVSRAGSCPVVKRRVECRPAPDGTACVRASARTCILSVDAPAVSNGGPTATRCSVDVYRYANFSGRAWSELVVHFPEAPYRAHGLNGALVMRTRATLREGVFAADDPDQPMGFVAGNMGGESIPIAQVNLTRLQILDLSPKVTIWTDDIHGTLDLDMSGGPFDPRRVVLHLEF
jgi:hypothetical protein